MPTSAPIADYCKCAEEKFAYYVKHYISDTDWYESAGWKLGNSLDTMLDYLIHVDSSGAESFGRDAQTQCAAWLGWRDADWTWFDDYGWFVISAYRAWQQTFFSAEVRGGFAKVSEDCWDRFKNAPYTWEWRNRDPDRFKDYGPAVDGPSMRGVWNTLWDGTSSDHLGDKEGIPSDGTLAGIQNTLTNALYLICAQRRGDTAAAEAEWSFLNAWCSSQQQPNLWWPQNNGGALVRERVSRFADGKTAPGFQENWAWTGDQGLILGGLVGRIANGQDAANARTQAEALLTGARLSLVDAHDGVLQPFTTTGTPPHLRSKGPDVGDYGTGTGVFWRYLLQAWNLKNPQLRGVLGSTDYQNFVRTNADAARAPATDADVLSNQIAALVAAIVMLDPAR